MWLIPELKPHISETVSWLAAGKITCVVTWLGVVAAHGAINNHWWPSDHPQSCCDLGGQGAKEHLPGFYFHMTHIHLFPASSSLVPPPLLHFAQSSTLADSSPCWFSRRGCPVAEEGCCPADSWLCWDSWCSAKVRNNDIHNNNYKSARKPGLEPKDCDRLTIHFI